MASNDVGSLNVKVSASTAALNRDMQTNARSVMAFAQQAEKADAVLARSGGGSSKAARGLLELSRGAEDAASVYGTMGLAGALRASSNNITQFASVIHPAAGAVAGFGVAIGTFLVPQLLKLSPAFKAAEQAQKDFINRTKEQRAAIDEIREMREFGNKLRDTTELGVHAQTTNELKDQLAIIKAQIAETSKLRKSQEQIINANRQPEGSKVVRLDEIVGEVTDRVNRARMKAVAGEALNKTVEDLRELQTKERILETQLKMAEADKRRVEALRGAKDEMTRQQEIESQIGNRTIENNRRREEERKAVEDLARTINSELNPAEERRMKIIDELRKRQEQIAKSPLNESDKAAVEQGARASAEQQLRDVRLDELRRRRDALQQSAPSIGQKLPPATQEALIRGSREALSAGIRAGAQRKPEEQTAANTKKIADEIKKLNAEIKRLEAARDGIVQVNF